MRLIHVINKNKTVSFGVIKPNGTTLAAVAQWEKRGKTYKFKGLFIEAKELVNSPSCVRALSKISEACTDCNDPNAFIQAAKKEFDSRQSVWDGTRYVSIENLAEKQEKKRWSCAQFARTVVAEDRKTAIKRMQQSVAMVLRDEPERAQEVADWFQKPDLQEIVVDADEVYKLGDWA